MNADRTDWSDIHKDEAWNLGYLLDVLGVGFNWMLEALEGYLNERYQRSRLGDRFRIYTEQLMVRVYSTLVDITDQHDVPFPVDEDMLGYPAEWPHLADVENAWSQMLQVRPFDPIYWPYIHGDANVDQRTTEQAGTSRQHFLGPTFAGSSSFGGLR